MRVITATMPTRRPRAIRMVLRAALAALAVTAASLALPARPAAAAWTPPEGLPAGFPAPPTNFVEPSYFSFSPRIAKKGDIVTINGTGGYINLLKVWSGYYTQGSLSPVSACPQTATSCTFRVGAPNGWQGWLALGANPGGTELGPYDALAILPSGPTASPPAAPTNASVVGGKGKATVSWKAPTNDGGAPIVGYKVMVYVAGILQSTKTFASTATTQVVSPLADGVPVTFRVLATNSAGDGSSSTSTPPVIPPFGSAASFVNRMALDLLGRPATSTESAAEVDKLNNGSNPGVVALDFRRSADATSNVDPTTRLYFAYLQRVPDKGGLQYWVGKKRGGMLISRISDTFAQSNEFKTKYGTLTNRQFVTRIYTDVLGRTADTAGVNFWTGQLDRRVKNRGQVMVGFSESSEYKRKKATSVDAAVTWISLLQAKPSATEFEDSVDDLDAGKTLDAFAFAIVKDPRYAARF